MKINILKKSAKFYQNTICETFEIIVKSQKTKCVKTNQPSLIHGPSLAIGAGIASIAIIIAIVALNGISELSIEIFQYR